MYRFCAALIFSTLLLLAGCTSVRPVSMQLPFTESISVGDTVIIETKNGEQFRFVVEAIDSESIAGGTEKVASGNIRSIERVEPSKPKTLILISGLTYLLLYTLLIIDLETGP